MGIRIFPLHRYLARSFMCIFTATQLVACAPSFYAGIPSLVEPTPSPTPANAPSISTITDTSGPEDTASAAIAFTISDTDSTLSCASSMSASSSNTSLVAPSGIVFSGTAPNCNAVVTPVAQATGAVTLTFTVSDGALSAASTFSYTVSAVNDAPSVSTIANQTTLEDTSLSGLAFSIADTDNTLTCAGSVTASSSNTSLIANSGLSVTGTAPSCNVSIAPVLNASGVSTITLTVSDGVATTTTTFTVTVTAVNDAPAISAIANQTTLQNTATGSIAYTISDVDSAVSCPGSITATSSNTSVLATGGISLGGTGMICSVVLTPVAAAQGTSNITLTVSDGALSASQSFSLTVVASNSAPTLSAISNQTTNEDTPTAAISFTITDAESTLNCATSMSISSSNTAVFVSGGATFSGTAPSCTLTLAPVANASGSSTITLVVTDGLATATRNFTLTVTAVNDAPTISALSNITTNEDTAFSNIAFTITDVDSTLNCSTSVSAASSNTSVVAVAGVSFSGTAPACLYTVTPVTNASGTSTITLTVTDGALTASSTSLVTVTAVNDTPVISAITAQTTNEDTATGSIAFTITDVDSTLTCASSVTKASSNTALAALSGITVAGTAPNCTVVLTPVANANGSANITLTVSDGNTSSNVTFTWTVTAVNDAPTIGSITSVATAYETDTAAIAVTINDVDNTLNCGTSLSKSSGSGTWTFGGTAPNCTLVITPGDAEIYGTTQVVRVTDGTLNTSTSFPLTVKPPSAPNFKMLASGANHTCGLTYDGYVYCWGKNDLNQLGNFDQGNNAIRPVPVSLAQVNNAKEIITQIYAGGDTSCGISNQYRTFCWGDNTYGQLGIAGAAGSSVGEAKPIDSLPNPGEVFVKLSIGVTHSCGISSLGNAYCWGSNSSGQLGDGTINDATTPVLVAMNDPKENLIELAISLNSTCAISNYGNTYCWGSNTNGELGKSGADSQSPQLIDSSVLPTGESFIQLLSTQTAFCAKGQTTVYCWGLYALGQSAPQSDIPRAITTSNLTHDLEFTAFSGSAAHSVTACGITSYGARVSCWTARSIPGTPKNTTTGSGSSYFTQVVRGQKHTCVIDHVGRAFCSGDDTFGQLGNGNSSAATSNLMFVDTKNITPFKTARTLSLGTNHACAMSTSGVPACWGEGSTGQIVPGPYASVPTFLKSTLDVRTMTREVIAGGNTTCIINMLGVAYCVGEGSDGQIGNGTSADISDFTTAVSQGERKNDELWLQLTIGQNHVCGLTSISRNIYCWGKNDSGQLGDKSTDSSSIPVKIFTDHLATGEFFLSVKAGNQYTCAMSSLHKLYCWGDNRLGQIGEGGGNTKYIQPTAVDARNLGDYGILDYSVGANHSLVLTSTSNFYGFGSNQYGELGTNGSSIEYTPTQGDESSLKNSSKIVQVFAGEYKTCGISSEGFSFCTGDNSTFGPGSLGMNDLNDRSILTETDADLFFDTIAVGGVHTCGRAYDGKIYCSGKNDRGQLGQGTTTNPIETFSTAINSNRF